MRFVAIALFLVVRGGYSDPLKLESLDLTEAVETFMDCNVYVVTSRLNLRDWFDQIKPIGQPLNILPSGVPTILFQYNLVDEYFKFMADFTCGKKQYFRILKSNRKKASKLSRALKGLDKRHRNLGVKCDAWIYVCPLQCKTWKRSFSMLDFDRLLSKKTDIEEPEQVSQTERYAVVVGHQLSAKEPMDHNIFEDFKDTLTYFFTSTTYLNNWKKVLLEVSWNRTESMYQVKKAFPVIFTTIDFNHRRCISQSSLYSFTCSTDYFNTVPSLVNEVATISAIREWPNYELKWDEPMYWHLEENSNSVRNTSMPISSAQTSKFCFFRRRRNIPIELREAALISFSIIFPNSTLLKNEMISGAKSPYFGVTSNKRYMQHVITQRKGFSFLVCSAITDSDPLSIAGFVSIFDLPTWTLLVTALTISGVCTRKLFRRNDSVFGYSLPVMVLLEQSTSNINKCKAISLGWILTGIVISNLYRGDNINNLIAPIKNRKLNSFESLLSHNFSFGSSPHWNIESFPILQKVWKLYMDNIGTLGYTFFPSNFDVSYLESFSEESSKIISQIANHTVKLNFEDGPNQFNRFLDVVSSCKENQLAYVDEFNKIHHEYWKLKENNKNTKKFNHITTSKKPLGDILVFWNFLRLPVNANKLFTRINKITDAGLPQIWDKWVERLITWNDTLALARFDEELKPLSLNDNVVVIFL